MNEYSFITIEQRALNLKNEDAINTLGEWYSKYGDQFWNGECYTGKYEGSEYSLYPIYSEADETDCYDIIGWELH